MAAPDNYLEQLKTIRADSSAISTRDPLAEAGKLDYDKELQKIELRKKSAEATSHELENTAENDRNNQRKTLATRLFRLAVGALVTVLSVVVASGIDGFSFHLSDQVLMALIGVASVNVLGLLAIVVRYAFSSK